MADPQGSTIERSLPALGFDGVAGVRVGKAFRFTLEAADEAGAVAEVDDMCRRFLTNPVIEDATVTGRGRRRGSRLMAAVVGVVVFPGSNCELDVVEAVTSLGGEGRLLWHGDASLGGVDAVVLPGGFAHGDYLRPGAIARFSPVMRAVGEHAPPAGPSSASATASRCSARPGSCPAPCRRTPGSSSCAAPSGCGSRPAAPRSPPVSRSAPS